ncbi:MAG: hypothetical protein IJY23_08565 [Clostridia bacterium]|nr:hypothetical protein [Clostridia bacterium]
MSDYERYGDYDEIDDDSPKSKNPIVIILKILIAFMCVSVVGLIAFRLIVFNNYPDSVEELYINDALEAHYSALGDNISVKTQSLRAPYDDEDLGNFFCDYLYVIEELGQLQITVRYNTSTVRRFSDELGRELDADDEDVFEYRLCASYGDEAGLVYYDVVSDSVFASQVMYRYKKLVFDGIDFSGEGSPYWIRLEVRVKPENDTPWEKNLAPDSDAAKDTYMIPIYENNENYSKFEDYKFKK